METSTAAQATVETPAVAVPQHTYASAPALEVRILGGGERITQKELLDELLNLPADWRLETPHELFALRSPLAHENQHRAHSYDESIQPDSYWTSELTPWFRGGRVVVGFGIGGVGGSYDDGGRARARAVRVACEPL